MMDRPLISIIMPVYNASAFISEAIGSVLAQTWTHWELIIVNDGSTDGTEAVLATFNDPRIIVLERMNGGVSRARNTGLEKAKGAYIAFLDADDVMPPDSLGSRALILMSDPAVMFVDGVVLMLDHWTGRLGPLYTPAFRGIPFGKLMELSSDCFLGCTWMIRRTPGTDKRFPRHMSHAEDLAFYLSMARAGAYDHTSGVVLHYRKGHGNTAMKDLSGLYRGYLDLYYFALSLTPPPTEQQSAIMWQRIRRIMFRGFLKHGRPLDALKVLLRRRPAGSQ